MNLSNPFPPQNCVPWFESNFGIGDTVSFLYNGGMGGIYPISGTITKIEAPEIYLAEKATSYTMADIAKITKHISANLSKQDNKNLL